MYAAPPTCQSLLMRLSDGQDRAAWDQFVEIYAPLIYQLAQRRGLQPADAADVVQEVLAAVADAFRRRKFDRSRGLFRGWLLTIARNDVNSFLAARQRRVQPGGGAAALAALGQIADPQEETAWDAEYQQRLFAWAAEQVQREVQPATWQAFWQTTVESRSGQDVAAASNMSVAAVYLAKSRVLKRLRELVRQIDEDADPSAPAK